MSTMATIISAVITTCGVQPMTRRRAVTTARIVRGAPGVRQAPARLTGLRRRVDARRLWRSRRRGALRASRASPSAHRCAAPAHRAAPAAWGRAGRERRRATARRAIVDRPVARSTAARQAVAPSDIRPRELLGGANDKTTLGSNARWGRHWRIDRWY